MVNRTVCGLSSSGRALCKLGSVSATLCEHTALSIRRTTTFWFIGRSWLQARSRLTFGTSSGTSVRGDHKRNGVAWIQPDMSLLKALPFRAVSPREELGKRRSGIFKKRFSLTSRLARRTEYDRPDQIKPRAGAPRASGGPTHESPGRPMQVPRSSRVGYLATPADGNRKFPRPSQ